MSDPGAPFSGIIVRSFLRERRRYREFFDWIRDGQIDDPQLRYTGDEIIDYSAFEDVPKRGPALLYFRALPVDAEFSGDRYFGGNLAAGNLDPPVVDPRTEAERLEQFSTSFPREMAEMLWGRPDETWDKEAARGTRWLTARAIVESSSETLETLCWLSAPREDTVTDISNRAIEFLASKNMHLLGENLIELYDTHYLRPSSSMLMFEINRRSKLSADEYSDLYVRV
jgi:hypothetical protein